MKRSTNTNRKTGFSLIELIVVVGVIGVLGSIAIGAIGRMNDAGQDAKNRRNAQVLASMFSSAQAAGINFYVTGDKTATIQAIVAGASVTDEGPFKDTFFGVPGMSQGEQDLAAPFLAIDDASSILRYLATSP